MARFTGPCRYTTLIQADLNRFSAYLACVAQPISYVAYNLRRFGTPGLNGLCNPRELRLAAARFDDRQLWRKSATRRHMT
jgi:hypothetical protein